jgi:hypothetical protein
MDLRGQRFVLDLSDEEGDHENETGVHSTVPSSVLPAPSSAFIGDIKERSTAPPTAPQLRSTTTGFPEHKARRRVSAFKQQRSAPTSRVAATSLETSGVPPTRTEQVADANGHAQNDPVLGNEERQRIDAENNRKLASMTAEEIDEERQELFAGLNPSLIERLLKRANLDDGRGDTGIEPPAQTAETVAVTGSAVISQADEGVSVTKPVGKPVAAAKSVRFEDDEEPAVPISTQPVSAPALSSIGFVQPAIHFPKAPSAPELDPSDPNFLENLHQKYYPSLPADPSKLAWMAPIPSRGSEADQDSPYYPNHEAISASALRFDFRGGILPPRIARAMPSTKGLHHHAEAPEAAGYTVPELARLARSAFPAQRCIAFQTLGRLLYRLGRGEWGDEDSEISKGLWQCIMGGKVIETLEESANADGGHQGSKVYAVEAVWLWQKGGGKRWKAS